MPPSIQSLSVEAQVVELQLAELKRQVRLADLSDYERETTIGNLHACWLLMATCCSNLDYAAKREARKLTAAEEVSRG